MAVVYSRPHRSSIYEPASIHDIPPEVLEIVLQFVRFDDLFPFYSFGLVARAWLPVVQIMMTSRASVHYLRPVLSRICGMHLMSIVSGFELYSVKTLSLDNLS
jgi:hypothetical protein